MGTEVISRVKLLRREVIQSPPPSAEVKNEWSYTFTPTTCLHTVNTKILPFFRFPVLGKVKYDDRIKILISVRF